MNYRKDFPMLKQNLVYFNSASTALKPLNVINSIMDYYTEYTGNTNRGVDFLGYKVTSLYEETRKEIASFLNSKYEEIVFTRGTTDSLNLVARSFGKMIIKTNDEIIVLVDNHHSNFLPWQELAIRKKAKLIILNDIKELEKSLNEKTKIVAISHVSNTTGYKYDLKKITKLTHENNAYIVVDGAQGIVYENIDVSDLDIDFYAFSGHKIFGPTGVGVLFGKSELLNQMHPITFGGDMVEEANAIKSIYKKHPYKFEAGTMMISEVIGLGEAIRYVKKIGIDNIHDYSVNLRNYLLKLLKEMDNITIYNEHVKDSTMVLFNVNDIHAHDVASFLDRFKIVVRAGHHCAELYMNYLKTNSTVRVSLSIYNNKNEIELLVNTLKKVGDYLNVLF